MNGRIFHRQASGCIHSKPVSTHYPHISGGKGPFHEGKSPVRPLALNLHGMRLSESIQ